MFPTFKTIRTLPKWAHVRQGILLVNILDMFVFSVLTPHGNPGQLHLLWLPNYWGAPPKLANHKSGPLDFFFAGYVGLFRVQAGKRTGNLQQLWFQEKLWPKIDCWLSNKLSPTFDYKSKLGSNFADVSTWLPAVPKSSDEAPDLDRKKQPKLVGHDRHHSPCY